MTVFDQVQLQSVNAVLTPGMVLDLVLDTELYSTCFVAVSRATAAATATQQQCCTHMRNCIFMQNNIALSLEQGRSGGAGSCFPDTSRLGRPSSRVPDHLTGRPQG